MNLREAISRLDKTKDNEHFADIREFSSQLNLTGEPFWSETFNKRIKAWYLYSWMCTDTEVGLAVYFLDDLPVAIGSQTARKNSEYIEFLGQYEKEAVRNFILELIAEENEENCNDVLDPTTFHIPEFYSVHYGSGLFNKKDDPVIGRRGIYMGQPVHIVRTHNGYNFDHSKGLRCDELLVELPDGNEIVVDCSHVLFPCNLK